MNDIQSEVTIKVTTIGDRYHARLLMNNDVLDEMACEEKCDIGYISRQMLRWHDKCGGTSEFASAVRDRMYDEKYPQGHKGRIWYQNQLDVMKEKNNVKRQAESNNQR